MPVEIDSDIDLTRDEFKKKIQEKYKEISSVFCFFLSVFSYNH